MLGRHLGVLAETVRGHGEDTVDGGGDRGVTVDRRLTAQLQEDGPGRGDHDGGDHDEDHDPEDGDEADHAPSIRRGCDKKGWAGRFCW